MHRTLIAPSAYVQGPRVVGESEHFDHLTGDRAYILGGDTALEIVRDRLIASLETAGIQVCAVDADVTACTYETIDRYRARREECGADIVVGVGGGVAVDVATAVAMGPSEYVSVPTIASTDAPCSTVSVVYDESGDYEEVLYRDRNPDLVLVDSRTIANAPTRFLRHGLGDAFATKFEAAAARTANVETVADGRSSPTAMALARECYRTIASYGRQALAAADRDAVTPALERVIEANILLSGLGFESAGTAGAHAIQIGLTRVGIRKPHGKLVGFGTIAELVLQDHEELSDAISLARELGIDVTLADLGAADVDLLNVGSVACEHGMSKEAVDTSPEAVTDAIRTADELLEMS